MDLVDSQYNELIEISRENGQEVSLDLLQEKHHQILKSLMNGCFLDDSISSKRINGSIQDILACILRTCELVEQSLDSFKSGATPKSFEALGLVRLWLLTILGDGHSISIFVPSVPRNPGLI